MTFPSADDFAWAIVAACRETGDDPLAVAGKAYGPRARHYAVHALKAVFPDARSERLAELVGCPGKGVYFWRNSCNQVANPTGHSSYTVAWWDPAVHDRVVNKVRAERTRRAVAPKVAEPIREVARPPRSAPPPTPLALPTTSSDRPVFDHGTVAAGAHQDRNAGLHPTSKADLNAMLREAAANTAALAPKE